MLHPPIPRLGRQHRLIETVRHFPAEIHARINPGRMIEGRIFLGRSFRIGF